VTELAVRRNHIDGKHVVDRKPKATSNSAEAAAGHQPADTCV
jgi:hypothetical protein